MALASQTPTSISKHAGLIDSLNQIVTTLPTSAYTPSLINYLLFPITQILRQSDPATLPDNFLEAIFRLLTHVTEAWQRCEQGMDAQAWEQLWMFTAAAIGPAVSSKGKGKARQVGQEVQVEAVKFLIQLLGPDPMPGSKDPLEEASHPSPAMKTLCQNAKSPLMPTLFQTITLAIELCSPIPPYPHLQRYALGLLRLVVKTYLRDQHEILASVLPGIVSAVARLLQSEEKAVKTDAAREAAELVKDVIVLTLNDLDLRSLGVLRPGLDDFDQLAEEWEKAEHPLPPEKPPPPSPAASISSSVSTNPFPSLTASYLAFTSTQLYASIPAILSTLSSHDNSLVRQASADLAYALVTTCSESLPLLIPKSVTLLLLLTRDEFRSTQDDARRKVHHIIAGPTKLILSSVLVDLLSDTVNAIPRLIFSQQDSKVGELARLVTALGVAVADNHSNPIAELLGPTGRIERWGWALLECLEFRRSSGWSATEDPAAKAADRGWEHRLDTVLLPSLIESEDELPIAFPQLPLRHVESEVTFKALREMLVQWGSTGGEAGLHSVQYLFLFAKANRRRYISKSVSAVWIGQKLLEGIVVAQAIDAKGRINKATRKAAREVTRIIVAMDEDDDDNDELVGDYELPGPDESGSDALIPVARIIGVNALTTLLDRKPLSDSAAASQTRRLHAQAQRALLTAHSLSALAVISRILSTNFRPLLLTSLYTILSHLSSPQSTIAHHAEIALIQVAYHCGYASPQNLILDNVDYVINVVSQRLTYARLSSTAPLVLIAMIRLVGEPIVPLVHDVVDEIFDALDDFHGYETLASSLLAVLGTLIEAMAGEVAATGPSEARLRKKAEYDRLGKLPDPEVDFTRFEGWHKERQATRNKEVSEILGRAPQHAWGQMKPSEAEVPQEDQPPMMDEDGETPTRTQEVCTLILEKSMYFLSHRSPFLRARILSLIARATPVLASGNREGDLLPIIDRGWGHILNRLDDSEPYVVTEAAEVIAALCENVGDFMSRRILDHVWPRFQRLLNSQKELDNHSALARKGGTGTQSSFTVSHRLHVAILATATFIAKEVPVNDDVLWQMMVLFRPFLDNRAHEDLQSRALCLYMALGRRDGDAIWVVIHATVGSFEGDHGMWDHLRGSTLNIGENANVILAGL